MELATGLADAIDEFAVREGEIEQERRSRAFQAKRALEKGRQHEEELLQQAVAAQGGALAEERAALEAKHAARAAWIERAFTASKRQLSKRAERERSETAASLQVKSLEERARRQADLEAVSGTYQQLESELGRHGERLEEVERKGRAATRGVLSLQRMMRPEFGEGLDVEPGPEGGSTSEYLSRVEQAVAEADSQLAAFRVQPLPRLLSFLPPWLLLVVGLVAGVAASRFWDPEQSSWALGGALFGAVVVLGAILQLVAGKGAAQPALAMARAVERARRSQALCRERIRTRRAEEEERLAEAIQAAQSGADRRWDTADHAAAQLRDEGGRQLERKHERIQARNQRMLEAALAPLEQAHEARLAELRAGTDRRIAQLQAEHDAAVTELEGDHRRKREEMEAEWAGRIEPLYEEASRLAEAVEPLSPPWDQSYLERWSPSSDLHDLARLGQVTVVAEQLAGEKDLTLGGLRELSVPLSLQLPREASILFETEGKGREVAVGMLNNVILRLLATLPPGKLNFTIIDPVGLGENFAGIMHLADYEDSVINGRIWTQRGQIEEKLAELNEHIEKVIQMYLRNEYETIADYNEEAGNIAEKYYFLVIADFPANFSETAAKRLQSIAMSGARCGIYTLIHWDRQQAAPQDFVPDVLRENSVRIRCEEGAILVDGEGRDGLAVTFDSPPDPALAVEFVQRIGRSSVDSNRVEVPFEHVMPSEGEFWTSETTRELRVPIGRTGATKLQYLAIGKGTRQHALFAGKTGSGKSTLFHVIISNLALWCSPDEVEFYLVDFKKGVEFKCYAAKKLPHARVVAIESDREFGLSVLKRVDEELKRRGDMFRKLGVQDVAGYKKAGGKEPVPRSLLIIDEFQELFVEDDRIAQDASVLLDRIVRQGRAFGIHVLLGSQTLGGAYSMARTTMGQMVIRVALQCNEADAYLIMDDTNPAPRMLTRPGEGIYNDSAGAIEGNSPFQVVWLSDEERDRYLDLVNEIAQAKGYRGPAPIVFEGNAPADVRENEVLHDLLHADSVKPVAAARAWLGAPNSIKGPTEATFHRQSGNNLLVIGQREEAALAILGVSLISLAAQFPKGGASFILCDGTAPGSSEGAYFESVVEAIPHEVRVVRNHDIPEVMKDLSAEMQRRASDEEAAGKTPPVFLVIENLQRFKKLKHEDDFDFSFDSEDSGPNPGAQLNEIVTEGTSLGLHVIATVDTYNNVNRFLSRKAVSEFEMRVIFQMSANDSAALVDSPAASNLGLHRALFYNEHEGYLETFRPYALPGNDWIEEAGRELKRLVD